MITDRSYLFSSFLFFSLLFSHCFFFFSTITLLGLHNKMICFTDDNWNENYRFSKSWRYVSFLFVSKNLYILQDTFKTPLFAPHPENWLFLLFPRECVIVFMLWYRKGPFLLLSKLLLPLLMQRRQFFGILWGIRFSGYVKHLSLFLCLVEKSMKWKYKKNDEEESVMKYCFGRLSRLTWPEVKWREVRVKKPNPRQEKIRNSIHSYTLFVRGMNNKWRGWWWWPASLSWFAIPFSFLLNFNSDTIQKKKFSSSQSPSSPPSSSLETRLQYWKERV